MITVRLIKRYMKNYPGAYKFHIHLRNKKSNHIMMKILYSLLFRKKKNYRLLDGILFNKFTYRFYRFLFYLMRKNFPLFINNRAMPMGKLLN